MTLLDDESGFVVTDDNGNFTVGPFVASENTNAGMWFVSLETENSTLPVNDPTTIAGDIVYWVEDFDSINLNPGDNVTIQDVVNYDSDKSLDLYATPTFVLKIGRAHV